MSEDQANPTSTSGTTKRARKPPRKKTARSGRESTAANAETTSTPPAVPEEKTEAVIAEPQPDAAIRDSAAENPKRGKRRRRKGKGESANAPAQAEPAAESATRPDAASSPARTKNDPELLAKFAWKIYLAEVSEEGVALIGDNDARELARRCFRLAEIFIDEQSRWR